jgi:hypothetical protein
MMYEGVDAIQAGCRIDRMQVCFVVSYVYSGQTKIRQMM